MSRKATIDCEIGLEIVICCECGMSFAFPAQIVQRFWRSHETFYCPAGHGQHFAGESDVEKLKRQLKATERLAQIEQERRQDAERAAKHAEDRRRATAAAHTRTKNRIAAGVCPCCNRSFENLRHHMATQHPEYRDEDRKESA